MKYENRMEHHYAVSKSGALIHIKEAHASEEECFCPHCGCRMLKRCGDVRAWHFAHYHRSENDDIRKCSYESYLHAFAKLRLKQWFEESESIILYYPQTKVCKYAPDCIWKLREDECFCTENTTVNLKKILNTCEIEKTIRDDSNIFRADLLWSNPKDPTKDILIEIKVTHECTQKKKESNKRIIEFEVHSEEDVEKIIANDIRESETVKFYGLKANDIVDENISPRHNLSKSIYYDTGKVFTGSACNCKDYTNRRHHALLEITFKNSNSIQVLPSKRHDNQKKVSFGRLSIFALSLAKSIGYNVRNCYLCEHHHYDYDNKKLTCELNSNKPCEASQALSCDNFKLNEVSHQKNLEGFRLFSKNNTVNVWSKK